MIARLLKRYQRRRVVEVLRHVIAGSQAAVISRVIRTQRSMRALINTSYIERLQATFRASLAPLVRRTRAGVHKHCTLEAGMWLVGTTYKFVWRHCSLREERTIPVMAAGITDHLWPLEEFYLPRTACGDTQMAGRKPQWLLEAECERTDYHGAPQYFLSTALTEESQSMEL